MNINCRGNLIDLSQPKVMGIINVTPDSFFEKSRKTSEKEILKTAEKMLQEGATFIDIGGYSSRPGAKDISAEEEISRVLPALKNILNEFPDCIISIDTFRSEVAERALENGAAIVNDISAGQIDSKMMQIVAKFQVPYIMMHLKGTPQTMAKLNQYNNMVQEILFYFSERIAEARAHGITDLILDPGFGFAKNIQQNFELLSQLSLFKIAGLPILAGLSRKSTVYKTLKIEAEDCLNGTSVLNTVALLNGANILRVHDVKEAMEVIKLTSQLQN